MTKYIIHSCTHVGNNVDYRILSVIYSEKEIIRILTKPRCEKLPATVSLYYYIQHKLLCELLDTKKKNKLLIY